MSAQETEDMYIIIVSCGLVAVRIRSSGYPCISKEKHICTFMDTCFRSSEDKVFLLYKTRAGVQDDVGILDLCNVHSMHRENAGITRCRRLCCCCRQIRQFQMLLV